MRSMRLLRICHLGALRAMMQFTISPCSGKSTASKKTTKRAVTVACHVRAIFTRMCKICYDRNWQARALKKAKAGAEGVSLVLNLEYVSLTLVSGSGRFSCREAASAEAAGQEACCVCC